MPSWVIIGASRGIGYQYLKSLSRDSSNVVIGLVRSTDATKEKLASDGIENVTILHGDLTDSASLYAAAKEVGSLTDGVLDHLVVNGAHTGVPSISLLPSDYVGAENEALLHSEVDMSMRTNATGALISINAFMPLLLKSSIKKVICITSGAADTSTYERCNMKAQLAYAMSKAALNVVVAKFAAEYRDKGVIFLALAPGFVNSWGMDLDNLPPEFDQNLNTVIKGFQQAYPHFKGPESMEENMPKQLNVINNVTLEQSGKFLSHHGNQDWV